MANTIVKATPPTKTDHATSLLFTSADKGVIQLLVMNVHLQDAMRNPSAVTLIHRSIIIMSLMKGKE